ncbi:Nicotinamide/nicotinic acid mononucleotide adenylyltransferase 1 [Orchesella cincta]|uniref:Nicotinamide-nucleotide adenylyltransferase n=1 Tax=Orchesella cincta TaxID=48709 RepID=A0A1D2MUU1_ORCCI|nr:Nicotinamide/nicotinic acid mononucleotide adenylyltransferase 1 [Orchesella cincta]
MSKQRVFLLSTGCFNPPTIMHLRIMELARDYLVKLGFNVIGGAVSPVHDAYGKQDLALSKHRLQMVKLALNSSDWVKLSSWEATNSCWTRTRLVLDHHQEQLTKYDRDISGEWLPDSSTLENDSGPVQLKVVCGADYLDSFNQPGLWAEDDMVKLARDYGLVVISREGNDPFSSIYKSDILYANKANIHIVHEWIRNEISSTKVRRAIRRSESVRYILPDPVVEYINSEKLYLTSQPN